MNNEYVVTDAILLATAREIRSVLPRWFTDTCDCQDAHADAGGYEDPQVYPCPTLLAAAQINQ